MPRTLIPIHDDPDLNDDWWSVKGMAIGRDVYYNAIRDASGRFDGYVIVIPHEVHIIKTTEQAEDVLRLKAANNGN